MPGFADIPGARTPHLDGDAFGLVDVAAEEVAGLVFVDEFAHRARAGVESRTDLVQRGAVWRGMADQHERSQFGELLQALGDLRLGVFPGGVEGRGAGISQAGDVPSSDLYMLFVKVVQSVTRAHGGDHFGGLVIAGQNVHLGGALGENFAGAVDSFGPSYLVAGGDVVIGVDGQQAVEGFPIVVDVGEDEEFHGTSRE